MRNDHEILEKLLEQILVMTDLPGEGEELLRDMTAALQRLLHRGHTLRDAANVLGQLLQRVGGDADHGAAERGVGREHGDKTELGRALLIDFEVSIQTEGVMRKAITTFLHGSVVFQSVARHNAEEGAQ